MEQNRLSSFKPSLLDPSAITGHPRKVATPQPVTKKPTETVDSFVAKEPKSAESVGKPDSSSSTLVKLGLIGAGLLTVGAVSFGLWRKFGRKAEESVASKASETVASAQDVLLATEKEAKKLAEEQSQVKATIQEITESILAEEVANTGNAPTAKELELQALLQETVAKAEALAAKLNETAVSTPNAMPIKPIPPANTGEIILKTPLNGRFEKLPDVDLDRVNKFIKQCTIPKEPGMVYLGVSTTAMKELKLPENPNELLEIQHQFLTKMLDAQDLLEREPTVVNKLFGGLVAWQRKDGKRIGDATYLKEQIIANNQHLLAKIVDGNPYRLPPAEEAELKAVAFYNDALIKGAFYGSKTDQFLTVTHRQAIAAAYMKCWNTLKQLPENKKYALSGLETSIQSYAEGKTYPVYLSTRAAIVFDNPRNSLTSLWAGYQTETVLQTLVAKWQGQDLLQPEEVNCAKALHQELKTYYDAIKSDTLNVNQATRTAASLQYSRLQLCDELLAKLENKNRNFSDYQEHLNTICQTLLDDKQFNQIHLSKEQQDVLRSDIRVFHSIIAAKSTASLLSRLDEQSLAYKFLERDSFVSTRWERDYNELP